MASPSLENNTYSVVSYLSFDSNMHGRTIMDSAAFLINPNTDFGANRLVAQINDTRGDIDTRKLPNNYGLIGPTAGQLSRPNKNLPVSATFAIGVAATSGGASQSDLDSANSLITTLRASLDSAETAAASGGGPVIGWES
jgi:hypothetical protein